MQLKPAPRDIAFVRLLMPQLRRAVAMDDFVDEGGLALALHKNIPAKLQIAVFGVGSGGILEFTIAAGDALLSQGHVLAPQQKLLKATKNQAKASSPASTPTSTH